MVCQDSAPGTTGPIGNPGTMPSAPPRVTMF
jgi:hypothetical protein